MAYRSACTFLPQNRKISIQLNEFCKIFRSINIHPMGGLLARQDTKVIVNLSYARLSNKIDIP